MPVSRRVLLGISGGIAAIKAPDLLRRLQDDGHEVRCILTRSAEAFVAPLPLEILSGQPVMRQEYLEPTGSGQELHIEMGRWAEVLCIAPATCNLLAKLALGLADDFLTTTALVFDGPLILVPAMSSEMIGKEVVRSHIDTLRARGAMVLGPVVGALATGEIGAGRMVEPHQIVEAIGQLGSTNDLDGKTVVVTAGPTREPLDSVRFLSNRSSGKMGFSLAAEAARRGARTVLIAGPVALDTPPGVERLNVVTAREMQAAVEQHAVGADLVVMTAAVADFRPAASKKGKIKKERGVPALELQSNPDILTELAKVAPAALRVGFAAETENLEAEGSRKLAAKKAHFIVANDVSRADIGFDADDNEVVVFGVDREPLRLPRQGKPRVARELFDLFVEALKSRETQAVAH